MQRDKQTPIIQTALPAQTNVQSRILDYHAVLAANRDVFLLNFSQEFGLFENTISTLEHVANTVATGRDAQKHSHVGLVRFLLIMVRQALNSFEAFSYYQSYQAWASLRPFLESALIMGKLMDDPNNAIIWAEREKDRTARKLYEKTFSRQNIISKSLPDSNRIRGVLTKINDDFMHVNPRFLFMHFEDIKVGSDVYWRLRFVDGPEEHISNFYSFLHLTRFVVDSTTQMFANKLPAASKIDAKSSDLQQRLKGKVAKLIAEHKEAKTVLKELGLWPEIYLSSAQDT